MHLRATLSVLLVLLPVCLLAQSGDIPSLVAKVRLGDGEEVAKLLPQLEKSRPNDAGVIFLRALLESNAEKSVELYQRIANEHSGSEWADDALYRLYQYSYAVGAYRTARTHLETLTKLYPKSPFAQRLSEDENAAKRGASAPAQTVKQGAGDEAAAGYSVQVGAYAKSDDANRMVLDLKAKGYTAFVKEKEVGGKTVKAVWLGRFTSLTQAQAFVTTLKKQQNIDAVVVKR